MIIFFKSLICGFIKKETAEQKLRSNNHNMKDYTYLLRFSDSVITDCQGQNLCGAISATVVTNKGKKGEKTKPNKKPVIDHVAAI